LALAALALVVFGAYDSYPIITVLGMKEKQVNGVIWLFLKINQSMTIL